MFSYTDFDNHERVVFCYDKTTGLKAIIAIHNINLGPALGGCRMYPYSSDEAALVDALRLSKGMTYKSAVAGVNYGGGKSVIIGDPRGDKTQPLFEAMGRFVDSLNGDYIVTQDSGITVEDLFCMSQSTRHVTYSKQQSNEEHTLLDSNPSPSTAYGVFIGIKAAVSHKLGTDDLTGIRVGIQGTGSVGYLLAQHLKGVGAKVFVSDINSENSERAVTDLGATAVDNNDIASLELEVYSPCALGGALNETRVEQLQAPIIAGAANNQLATPDIANKLMQKGILYAPDFVINAGGIINCYHYMASKKLDLSLNEHLHQIGPTLDRIFSLAKAENIPTNLVAERIAEERFQK